MPAIPRPGESVQSAVQRQGKEGKRREARAKTARRNRGGKAPAPPKPKARGSLLSVGETPVFKTGNQSVDRKNERRAERKDAQYRRNQAVSDYTSRTKAEREKFVADAEKRVGTKAEQPNDQYVLDAHYRRTEQQNPKVGREKVAKANARHDREVVARRSRLAALADTQKNGKGGLLGVLEGIGKTVGGVAGDGIEGLASVANRAAGSKQVPGAGGRTMSAGIAGNAPRALALPVLVAKNTGQAAIEDPSVLPKTGKGLLAAIPDMIVAPVQAVKDPKGTLSGLADDYSERYGWAFEQDSEKRSKGAEEQRERIKKEGAASEVLDAAIAGPSLSVGAAKVVRAATRKAAPGTRAGRLHEVLAGERPRLAVGPSKSVPQRKSKGLIGAVAQHQVDSARGRRVVRQLEAKVDKQRAGGSPTTKRERERENQRFRANYGRGVRGVMPKEGEVAHLSAGLPWAFDRQKAAQRKHRSRIDGTTHRRVNRAADEFARPAERAMLNLRPEERRAARAALEGRLNIGDPVKALAQVEQAIAVARRERKQLLASDRKSSEYQGLLNDQTDNVKSLVALRNDLRDRPGKVLTPKLREFVQGERAQRPRFEEATGQVVGKATQLRRRMDPAAVQFGTYATHEAERAAVDRLRTVNGDVRDAVQAIRTEREAASLKSPAGKKTRDRLGREQRALERITDGQTKVKDLDALEMRLVEQHAERTTAAAKKAGVDDFDPVYFAHRSVDEGGLSEMTGGSGGRGKVGNLKRSSMELHKLGLVDETPGAYAQGKNQAGKRAAQWQMIDEITHDYVPDWAKGPNGMGITRKQFRSAVRANGLDPRDWVLYQSKSRMEAAAAADGPGSTPAMMTLEEIDKLEQAGPDGQRLAQGRFHVVPREIAREMNTESGGVARGVQRLSGGSSGVILGSNPFYAVRQTAQQGVTTLIHAGPFGLMNPQTWQSFYEIRKAHKNNRNVMDDLHDRFGVRSRMRDFTESPRMGALARDERRWAQTLRDDSKIVFGFDWTRALEERRSPGLGGSTSVGLRTLAKRNPVALAFRASKAFNMHLDEWQDRLQRDLVLAIENNKARKRGVTFDVRDDFPQELAQKSRELAEKMGPLLALSQLPWKEYKLLDRDPQVRHALEELGDAAIKWQGDYANYSRTEQKFARSVFMFYGFVRHSGRLLGYTLPMEHPAMFATALQAAQITAQEKADLLEQFTKVRDVKPEMMRGLVVFATGDKLNTIDLKWINPALGPLQEMLDNGLSASVPVATPFVAALEARFGKADFTGKPLTNEQGDAIYDNSLSMVEQARVWVNRVMNMPWPVRVGNEVLHGDKGKLADTSIPIVDPVPIVRKKGGKADKRNRKRIREAQDLGRLRRAAMSGAPFVPKPGSRLIDAALYEAEKDKPKKPKKKSVASGFGGGGGMF